MFTQENSKQLQNERHFSDNDMKYIVLLINSLKQKIIFRAIERATRIVFGRPAVESGSRDTRVALNHSLDELFEGRQIKLKYKPKKKKKDDDAEDDADEDDEENLVVDDDGLVDIVRPVALCNDPAEFVCKAMLDRNLNPAETDIKIGRMTVKEFLS